MPLFNYEDVFLFETLGEGGFGKVQKGYHKREQNFVAIKTFKELDEESIKQIMLEDNLLQKVEGVSIQSQSTMSFLKYYGAFKDPQGIKKDAILLQMESGICTLDDILSAGKEFGFPEFLDIMRGLIKGFSLLQKKGIANRDIKPQNIILVEDEKLEGQFFYKVSDFGIGCQLPENCDLISCSEISGLSKPYAAPEVIKLSADPNCVEDYNPFIADVYSFGILALKMIKNSYGKKKLKSGLLSRKDAFPAEYAPFLCVLEEMLQEDHTKRKDFIRLYDFFEEKIQSVFKNIKFDFQNQKDREKTQYFYDLWLEKKETKAKETIEGLQGLFEEHKNLYEAYERNVSRLKQAFKHLNKAWEIFQQLKKRRLEALNDPTKAQDEKEITEEIHCLNSFGSMYQRFGDYKKAEENLFEALKICQMNDHNTTQNKYDFAHTFNNLGLLHYNNENLPKSEEFHLKALKIRLDLFGEMNEAPANSYKDLGLLYQRMGNFPKAEEFYHKSLIINLDLFGSKHYTIADLYNNLGILYRNMGDLPKTEEFYLKSLEIELELFGEKHADIAVCFNNLGLLYKNMGNTTKAEEFYLKALKIQLELLGEMNSATANTMNNLGVLYKLKGNLTKAEEFYLKALKIHLGLFGENNSATANSYSNLGMLLFVKRDLSKALEYISKAYTITRDVYGENHPTTIKYFQLLSSFPR